MLKTKKLLIVGDSLFAEVAYEYFSYDSQYIVQAFTVESRYIQRDSLFGLPVVPFEEVQKIFSPNEHHFYAAIVYTGMNGLRTRLYREAREKGFSPASYIHKRAYIWRNCEIGEHCFIFEDNVIQPFVSIGNNVILWSGNHIGHHSVISDNVFISSHVVISGRCEIGDSCFIGVNSALADRVRIGKNCLLGAGSLVLGDVADGQKVIGVWKRSSERET